MRSLWTSMPRGYKYKEKLFMPERIAAYIMMGGRLPRSRVPGLLKAIREAGVAHDWGECLFEPADADQLLTVMRGQHLWLCDEQASWGEFPELEKACRTLALGYMRHSDAGHEFDPEIAEWRLGMAKPIVRIASNCGTTTYTPTGDVKKALKHLKAGQVAEAAKLLRRLCPNVPKLPSFKIV